jgi:hypothetical protein
MFERQRSGTLSKAASIVCIVYLIPVTALYAFVALLYSNWVNRTVVLLEVLWLLAFGPPLLSLWAACVLRLRLAQSLGTLLLPRGVVAGLGLGIAAVLSSALYAGYTYPWLGRMHMGPVLAAIAMVGAPGAVAAFFFIRGHHAAQVASQETPIK